jgi:hypothetical protein
MALLETFDTHKAPLGLLPKLIHLAKNTEAVEFIIDDSTIQGGPYDPASPDGISRMKHILTTVKQWTEFLAFIPSVKNVIISYTVTKRQDIPQTKDFRRGDQGRLDFVNQIHKALDNKVKDGDSGMNLNSYDNVIKSFNRAENVARFLLAIPFVSDAESERLGIVISTRLNKKDNPVTILSLRTKFSADQLLFQD